MCLVAELRQHGRHDVSRQPPTFPKKRNIKQAVLSAMELVHWGSTISMAASECNIKRTTLNYHVATCMEDHEGHCRGAYIR